MRKIEIHEGYYNEGWHSLERIGFVAYPENYDFRGISHMMEGDKLFIEGSNVEYDPASHGFTYQTAGRGCKCDGCLQDDCDEEIPCSWCNASSTPQQNLFYLPKAAVFEEEMRIVPHISYASDDLIDEVKADIAEFGENEEVCALVEYFPEYDKFFYTDYDFENMPEEGIPDNGDTVFMTLGELLPKLEKQNKIIGDEEE